MKVFFYTPYAKETLLNIKSYNDLLNQKMGLEFWIHRTYYMLSQRSSQIVPILTNEIPDSGIVLFHKGFFPKSLKPNKNQFFICVQADYGRHRFAQMHIVQNPFQVYNFKVSRRTIIDKKFSYSTSYYISHWPQSSIIKRSNQRNSTISNLSFYGNIEQIDKGLELQLAAFCNKKNIKFIPRYNPLFWNDYSNTDIAIAIRSFDNNPYYHKPFSKLVNAVIAGSLVIAGPESSSVFFKEKYFPQLPIIDSFDGLTKEINNIIKHPEIYFEHLYNCKNKIIDLTEEGVISQWENMLSFANEQFSRWKNASSINRSIFFNYRSI